MLFRKIIIVLVMCCVAPCSRHLLRAVVSAFFTCDLTVLPALWTNAERVHCVVRFGGSVPCRCRFPPVRLSAVSDADDSVSSGRCKKNDVPIEKVYNKTQRDKFRWAIDMAEADYQF